MRFSKLYIDEEVIEYPLTRHISSNLGVPIRLVYDQLAFLKSVSRLDNPIDFGKKNLYLTKNKSDFVKKCPGTQEYVCCGYHIIHLGAFCPMDCSYCILQAYFHPPLAYLFVNFSKLEKELDTIFDKGNIIRIGTGEYTDSLVWENFTEISQKLIEKFSNQNKSVLELKTKTTNINSLKKIIHNRKTIISWSINPSKLINSEEKFTASLVSRLEAASKCEAWGYPIAFHLDPIFIYTGCKEDYRTLIKAIFDSVSSSNIVWISMGSFRFMSSLKEIISKRAPNSKIVYGEFIKSIDGKMRYFKSIRIEIYRYIVECIRSISREVFIYFCMEDSVTWKEVMDFEIKDGMEIANLLDNVAISKCQLYKRDKYIKIEIPS